MKPYNVEIFDQKFNLIHHTNISDVNYSYDYLSLGSNKVTLIYDANVRSNQYVRIYRDDEEYFGRIKSVNYADARHLVMGLDYQPIESVFDSVVVFDTTKQGTQSLESTIAELITAGWINNADAEQNVYGLQLSVESSTADWSFYIEPDDPEVQTLVDINLYEDIIVPALTEYQIGLYVDVSVPNKTITIHIKKQASDPYYIEADLPSVFSKNIVINETTNSINKLVVLNKGDLTDSRIYFLHTDGTYDQTDTDRLIPVVYKVQSVKVKTPEEYQERKQRDYESGVSTITRINEKEEALDDKDRESVQKAVNHLNEIPNISLTINPSTGKVNSWNEATYQNRVDAYIKSYAFEQYCRDLSAQEMQQKSNDKADKQFGNIEYNNLIELKMLNDDSLVAPAKMEMGQLVNIISNGISYASILTAKSVNKTTTLTFGTLRLDLTKILKVRTNDG